MNLPDFLTQEPDGFIHVTDHRIGLLHVIEPYKKGYSLKQLVEEYPTLSPELVQLVIDFYLANRSEVDEYVAAERAELERQYAAYTPGPGILRIRRLMQLLQTADAKYGPDSQWSSLSLTEKIQQLEQEAGKEAV